MATNPNHPKDAIRWGSRHEPSAEFCHAILGMRDDVVREPRSAPHVSRRAHCRDDNRVRS